LIQEGFEEVMLKGPLAKEKCRGIKVKLMDVTKGVQYLRETMELIQEGFEEVMLKGPLAKEKCRGIKVKLMDVKLHEDSIHRGPAQVIPAVRSAIFGAILLAEATFLEPVQGVFINIPQNLLGNVTREIQGRRGQIVDMKTEGDMVSLQSEAPVAEMLGFAGDIRSAMKPYRPRFSCPLSALFCPVSRVSRCQANSVVCL